MSETWDIYDRNRKKTGRYAKRDVDVLKKGEYHIAVECIIINSKNQILISQRAMHKKFPGMWECNGGSILKGETSIEGMIREINEELGIHFTKKEGIFFKTYIRDEVPPYMKDYWIFKKDFDIDILTFPDKETVKAKWATYDEVIQIAKEKNYAIGWRITPEEFEEIINKKQREAYLYIGKDVDVVIDRKINTSHPKFPNSIYPINYGYIPNTIAADGKEIDVYLLGVKEPVDTFRGKCIAVIHRYDDDDDKVIVVPEGMNYTDEEIRKETYFQEQYFESEIIR